MKLTLLIFCLIALVGCAKPLTNKEIVEQRNFCTENKMGYLMYFNFISEISKISCYGDLK